MYIRGTQCYLRTGLLGEHLTFIALQFYINCMDWWFIVVNRIGCNLHKSCEFNRRSTRFSRPLCRVTSHSKQTRVLVHGLVFETE